MDLSELGQNAGTQFRMLILRKAKTRMLPENLSERRTIYDLAICSLSSICG